MLQKTKSLNLIHPYTGDDGKSYTKVPKQSPHLSSDKNITNKDYTVYDKLDTSSIIANLEKYGVVIVKNFIPKITCDDILNEVEPYFFRDQSWNGSPFPKETTVVTRSVLKSKTSLNEIACNPIFSSVSSNFLNESNYFWIGEKIRTGNSSIQLNSGIVYKVGPGASNQIYHREDMVHHNIHKDQDQYKYGNETMVGLSVAYTNTNKQNGATRVIPGSHLWGPFRYPNNEYCNYIELEKGDAAFILGATYHAASANRTVKDRINSFYFMTKSYLKQEENLFIDQVPQFFKSLSVEALNLLGLNLAEPFCGHVDYGNPLNVLKSKEEIDASTLIISKENYGETILPEFI